MRNTFKKWEFLVRIDPELEKTMMDHKMKTRESYNEQVNNALKQYFDGANKGMVDQSFSGSH